MLSVEDELYRTGGANVVAPSEKLRDQETVIRFCRDNKLPAYVVGRWVWISFESKPDTDVRAGLKAAGFIWSSRRGRWAHNCGYHTTKGKCVPWFKYGEVAVSELDLTVEV